MERLIGDANSQSLSKGMAPVRSCSRPAKYNRSNLSILLKHYTFHTLHDLLTQYRHYRGLCEVGQKERVDPAPMGLSSDHHCHCFGVSSKWSPLFRSHSRGCNICEIVGFADLVEFGIVCSLVVIASANVVAVNQCGTVLKAIIGFQANKCCHWFL